MEDQTQQQQPPPQQQQQQQQQQPQDVRRTLSVSSRAAVNTVGQLRERCEQLEEALRKTTEVVSSESSTIQELLEAKLELAQIVGSLEKFQFNEVDAVATHGLTTGKDEVRQQRKDLTREVTALAEEATSRHREAAELITAMSPSSSNSNSNSNSDGGK
ncbi:unnamed protein product [Ectocarpus sp. 12 AP-2014]